MNSSLFRRKKIENILKDLHQEDARGGLLKVLTVKDLTLFGIAAIIGAGIFSTIGKATFHGGPAVTMLFLFTAVACGFTALSYAQFASTIPVSGSAYTYAYVSFGELAAWIIGWALILEYAVSNMVVAISWSEYFVTMMEGVFRVHWPRWLATDYGTAHEAYKAVVAHTSDLPSNILFLAKAYEDAPEWGGFKLIFNLPAGLVTLAITSLIYIGIKESKNVSNFLVYLKLGVIFLVLVGGISYVQPENWTPFAPNGTRGVLLSVASVFFAFIGFDSISTTAEETINPQRDLPRAMFLTLIVCTTLYIMITLVLTGMVNYTELGVNDPLAFVFQKVNLNWMAGIISVSAVVAITSALLAYQVGQPRIWMTMSRDGLLPKRFSKLHPKYKTPGFSTIITGLLVGIPSMFMNMEFFIDLTSVGTLFAFILVCGGILYMDKTGLSKQSTFKVPYINAKYLCGLGLALVLILTTMSEGGFEKQMLLNPLIIFFYVVWFLLAVASLRNNFSLIPVLGILTNLYLMTELGWTNWRMFLIWLGVGLIVYLFYGRKKSRLALS